MVITFVNNATYYSYIGIGGTNDGGYYANNMFLQANNALVFNTNSYTGGNIPRMIIYKQMVMLVLEQQILLVNYKFIMI